MVHIGEQGVGGFDKRSCLDECIANHCTASLASHTSRCGGQGKGVVGNHQKQRLSTQVIRSDTAVSIDFVIEPIAAEPPRVEATGQKSGQGMAP